MISHSVTIIIQYLSLCRIFLLNLKFFQLIDIQIDMAYCLNLNVQIKNFKIYYYDYDHKAKLQAIKRPF